MNTYDLTQAIKRYRVPIIVALVVLVASVLLMTFTIQDGSPGFRTSLDYEASVQIAVVNEGTDSLITSDGSGADLTGVAELYSSMLGSSEAAEWIAAQNGYKAEGTVDASASSRSTVITASVVAPTADQARGAAMSTFDWLNKKLLEPVTTSGFPTTTTTAPPQLFDGPVPSQINIAVDDALAGTSESLFLSVETEGSAPFVFPIAQKAGELLQNGAIVDPFMTIVISVLSESDEQFDTIRLAPPLAPRVVQAAPQLGIALSDGFLDRSVGDGDASYSLDATEIQLEWQEGFVADTDESDPDVVAVELALLTTEPGVTSSGGRRGPILALSVLLVGFILILASVVVADTWRKDRDSQMHVAVAVRPADVEARPADVEARPADVEARPADVEARPADVEATVSKPMNTDKEQSASWKQ